MYATEHDIATLRKLQEVDRKVVSAKKEFKGNGVAVEAHLSSALLHDAL